MSPKITTPTQIEIFIFSLDIKISSLCEGMGGGIFFHFNFKELYKLEGSTTTRGLMNLP